jgi:hypothetical protein
MASVVNVGKRSGAKSVNAAAAAADEDWDGRMGRPGIRAVSANDPGD